MTVIVITSEGESSEYFWMRIWFVEKVIVFAKLIASVFRRYSIFFKENFCFVF